MERGRSRYEQADISFVVNKLRRTFHDVLSTPCLANRSLEQPGYLSNCNVNGKQCVNLVLGQSVLLFTIDTQLADS